jgi:pyruvate-ferredoxin/flavodoxin oxidoreductase
MPTVQTPVPPYPGVAAVVDGSEAIASVETRISEIACAYPITPSTTMAAIFQAAVADGRPNLWGTPLRFIELESEHSSASSAEGAALAGARVTNFTAGQGLVLMKEVLFVISGKRLPIVFQVGARALTSQALNIHAGHDDVMAVADTGWGILFARNAQEAADLTAIARRVAEATEVPFFVVQDGFLTTHTLESMRLPEDELLRRFVGDPRERVRRWFDPTRPLMTGVVQNQDSYMKGRLGQRAFYERVPGELDAAFEEWGQLTGRPYGGIAPYRTADATEMVIAMGTIADSATAVVDHLRALGRPVGCVGVTSFRPFPAEALWNAVAGARSVAVIERTDEPAAHDNPLTREVKAALFDHAAEGALVPRVRSVSAGLGSRDVAAGDLVAVFDWLADHAAPAERRYATLGIRHPLALETRPLDLRAAGAYSLRSHSIGGFGSVTTNKLVASLVGGLFGLHVQAYPRYGSEKKGLPTTYYLTGRHRADPPARGARARRLRRPARRRGVPPGRPTPGSRRRRHGLRCIAASRPRGDLELDPRRVTPRHARARHPAGRPRHGRAGAGAGATAGSRLPHAGRRAGRRVPPPDALRRHGRARSRRAHGCGQATARAVLRQARWSRRGRQPRSRRRGIRRGHRCDRGRHGPRPRGTP